MKIKTRTKFIYILMMLLLLVACFPLANSVVHAESQVMSTDMDENLFDKLARAKGGGISYTYLTTESFNNSKFETLDLSGNGTVYTDSNIQELSGLTMFKFQHTKTLILSDNSIQIITAEILSAFPYLEKLVVSNNILNSIDISGCRNLKTVILDNNLLESFDASALVAKNAEIDLSSNLLDSIHDLTLPSQTVEISTTIKLYNNNISDYQPLGEGYTTYLGIQGLQDKENIVQQNQPIVYYKTNNAQQIKIVISSNGEEKYTFVDDDFTEFRNEFDIPNGNYEVSYYFIKPDTTIVDSSTRKQISPDGQTFYKYSPADPTKDVNSYLRYYKYREFSVLPTKPTFVFLVDGETYEFGELSKIKKESTILVSADEDAKVYYRTSANSEWVEGREIPVERGGRYSIDIKAVSADGLYTSEITTVYITASANLKFPDILLIFVIIIGAVALFGVGFPLLRKYVL